MDIRKHEFVVPTSERFEITKITPEVERVVEESDLDDGMAFVSTAHTTAVVSINEHEERLMNDMVEKFEELVPPEAGYAHDRHHIATDTQLNTHSHMICAMLRDPSLLTVADGELELGTWEDILLFEVDGPNERTVKVTLLE